MNFASRAAALDSLLQTYQAYWQFNIYRDNDPSHLEKYPTLLRFLQELNDEQVHVLQGDDAQLLRSIAPYFPAANEILALITLNTSPAQTATGEPPTAVPGRKWRQINAFIQAHNTITRPVLEWCSGKGYLSAAISQKFSLAATGLEIDALLVAAGNSRAVSDSANYQIKACDVLSECTSRYIEQDQHLLALHACGGLHQHMLRVAVAHQCQQISLAPCCYHRYVEQYSSLSTQCKSSLLELTRDDLRTAVRQTRTARSGETLARRTLQAWHLGFRAILEQLGLNSDITLPSLPHSWSKRSFSEFCLELVERKQLRTSLPSQFAEFESTGWQRLQRAERVDLVRMAFRRAIELRCVLDNVLFLEEHGYQCALSVFCAPQLSPRNLLIQARKSLGQ
jgi:hypothetical protein